jgi:hypothetical protein
VREDSLPVRVTTSPRRPSQAAKAGKACSRTELGYNMTDGAFGVSVVCVARGRWRRHGSSWWNSYRCRAIPGEVLAGRYPARGHSDNGGLPARRDCLCHLLRAG